MCDCCSQDGQTDERWGVIFDLDGVIVDSGKAHYRSWQMLAEETGLALSAEQFASTFGQVTSEIIQRFWGKGKKLTEQQIRRLDDRKEQLYRQIIRGRVPTFAGVRELIKALHEAGARLAIGSSAPPENVELVLSELQLKRYFPVRIDASAVTRGKPDPQVFELASTAMDVPPRRCAVIEDAPAGVEAARRAGMLAIAVTNNHPREALSHADLVVASLAELSAEQLKGQLLER